MQEIYEDSKCEKGTFLYWVRFFIQNGAGYSLAVAMAKTQLTKIVNTQINVV